MNVLLKVISILLTYPGDQTVSAKAELIDAINADSAATATQKESLCLLVRDLARRDLYDSQERYVYLFDRTRTLSLHLFEHVHGESRDRGQAMVDLREMYIQQGLDVTDRELPDYLPMFLEFLSTRPVSEASELLGQIAHILSALRVRLVQRHSVYAHAFTVLEELAGKRPDRDLLDALLQQTEVDPNDFTALDESWDEAAVTFAGNTLDDCANGCEFNNVARQGKSDIPLQVSRNTNA